MLNFTDFLAFFVKLEIFIHRLNNKIIKKYTIAFGFNSLYLLVEFKHLWVPNSLFLHFIIYY